VPALPPVAAHSGGGAVGAGYGGGDGNGAMGGNNAAMVPKGICAVCNQTVFTFQMRTKNPDGTRLSAAVRVCALYAVRRDTKLRVECCESSYLIVKTHCVSCTLSCVACDQMSGLVLP
jgi:hypothetical protein